MKNPCAKAGTNACEMVDRIISIRLDLRRPPRTVPAGPHLRNSATLITARKSGAVNGEHSGTHDRPCSRVDH